MRHGHGPTGVTGLALNGNQMKVWSLSEAAISDVTHQIKTMRGERTKIQTAHKEKGPARIVANGMDRKALRDTLNLCINTLAPEEPDGGKLINIFTGQLAPDGVNVEEANAIGGDQMKSFRNSWPQGFYSTISKKIVPFDIKRKHIAIEGHRVIYQNLIYSRALGLLVSDRNLNFSEILSCELTPDPASCLKKMGPCESVKPKPR